MKSYDIAIIGGGVIGSAIAHKLAHYKVSIAVFEKGSDVASAASKANSGVIHSGINSTPGSLKAQFCVQGNTMMNQLSQELNFSVKWVGKYVIAQNTKEEKELDYLLKVGQQNNVPDLSIVDAQEVLKKEPHIRCQSALWVPTAGILLPYEFTIALAENAAENTVQFHLEAPVTNLSKTNNGFVVHTPKGKYQASVVINAAGVHCRDIVAMVEEPDFNVYPCRGEYLVLDKNYASLISSMIYPVPNKEISVLGIHITPTIEGNILIGPSAEFIEQVDDTQTTRSTMDLLIQQARTIIPHFPQKAVINAYAGIRCKIASASQGGRSDYRIEESKNTPGLINLIGIESPGITAAPAIAERVKDLIADHFHLKRKSSFKNRQYTYERFSEMPLQEQKKRIQQDPQWGRIICRCEHVTEAEVLKALNNPLGAQTLAAVKYRCRACMGRCQGGFCTQHIIRLMEQYKNISITDMKLKSPHSHLFTNRTREVNED